MRHLAVIRLLVIGVALLFALPSARAMPATYFPVNAATKSIISEARSERRFSRNRFWRRRWGYISKRRFAYRGGGGYWYRKYRRMSPPDGDDDESGDDDDDDFDDDDGPGGGGGGGDDDEGPGGGDGDDDDGPGGGNDEESDDDD